MKISVIIPTYNRAGSLLGKAIDSVLSQTHTDVELIVVDDGSTDDTSSWLYDKYQGQLHIVTTANKGPSAARNTGIANASAELIAFLDSDDWWDADKLKTQSACMVAQPEYLISHTDEIWYRRGTFLNQKKKHKRPHGMIFKDCLPLCCVGMSTVMVRRAFFERVGLFDEDLPCCEDYDLWLRAAAQLEFLKINEPFTFKQGGREDQVSALHRVGMDQFRIKALEKCLGHGVFSAKQRLEVRRELVRKCTIYGNGCVKHGRVEIGHHYLALARSMTD